MTKIATETDEMKIETEIETGTDGRKTASRTRTRLRTARPSTNASLGLPTHRPSPSTKQSRLATNPKNAAAASPVIEDAAAANPSADPIPDTRRAQRGRRAQNLANFRPS